MHLLKYHLNKPALIAFKNRQEIIKAGLEGPERAFIEPMPIPPVKVPVESLNPAPTRAPNTVAGEGRTRPHQALTRFPPQKLYEVHQPSHSEHRGGSMGRATVWFTAVLLGLVTLPHGAAYAAMAAMSEVVTLDTRPGVTQSFLLLEPKGSTKDVVILFPGHEGAVRFRETAKGYEVEDRVGGLTGSPQMRNTLWRNGFAVALVAPPSDRSQLVPWFRASAEHAQDVHKVIAYLRERYPKLYLHGHCQGSLSAASVATRLKSKGISGLILSSARSSGPAGAVTDFERGAVSVRVLLVQHKEDSCPYTRPNFVGHVQAFYQNSAPKVNLITVTGGNGRVPMNETCQNGFHAFKGVQRETAEAIASWLLDKEFPALVEGAKE